MAVGAVALQQAFGLQRTFAHGEGTGHAERIKTVKIASRGQHFRVVQHITARSRGDVVTAAPAAARELPAQ
jgi:hypothetical protein